MKYMFMDGPFEGQVIKTEATKIEMNSKPNIKIEFVTGPFEGLIATSVLCYDRRMVEAREVYAQFKPTNIKYTFSQMVL